VRVLIIDNYDSFTYNLVQHLQVLGADVIVARNDEIDLAGIAALGPDRLLISPGPCDPDRAGISLAAIQRFAGALPILGVCLGHQCIGQGFGGRVVPARALMHGKTSPVWHDGRGVFAGLPSPFDGMRYHSLAVARDGLPAALAVSAWTEDGEIMGLRHRELQVEGVQFHPESILTVEGLALLRNFLGPFRRQI
jgi:anthranilate synthase/aminodeoxychorismate synthase-like glutamine amidotransferase